MYPSANEGGTCNGPNRKGECRGGACIEFQCSVPADCPNKPSNPACGDVTCIDHKCGINFKNVACDSGNACWGGMCMGGDCLQTINKCAGTSTPVCHNKTCVQCNSDQDCPQDPMNSCFVNKCNTTTHQCVKQSVNEGMTCMSDGKSCTNDVCKAGVCQHPVKSIGEECDLPNGAKGECDDAYICRAVNLCDGKHGTIKCSDLYGKDGSARCSITVEQCCEGDVLKTVDKTKLCKTGFHCAVPPNGVPADAVCTCDAPYGDVCCEDLFGNVDFNEPGWLDDPAVQNFVLLHPGEACGEDDNVSACTICYDGSKCGNVIEAHCPDCTLDRYKDAEECRCYNPNMENCSSQTCLADENDPANPKGCKTACGSDTTDNCYIINSQGIYVTRGHIQEAFVCSERIGNPTQGFCKLPGSGGLIGTYAGNTNAGNTIAGNTNAGNTNAGNTNAGNTNAGNTIAGNTNAGNTIAGDTGGNTGGSTGSTGSSGSTGSTGSTGSQNSNSSKASSNSSGNSASSKQSSKSSGNSSNSSGNNSSGGNQSSNGSTAGCSQPGHTCLDCIRKNICVSCTNPADTACTKSCKQFLIVTQYPDGSSCTPCTIDQLLNEKVCPGGSSQGSQGSQGSQSSGGSQSNTSSKASSAQSGSSQSSGSSNSSGASNSSGGSQSSNSSGSSNKSSSNSSGNSSSTKNSSNSSGSSHSSKSSGGSQSSNSSGSSNKSSSNSSGNSSNSSGSSKSGSSNNSSNNSNSSGNSSNSSGGSNGYCCLSGLCLASPSCVLTANQCLVACAQNSSSSQGSSIINHNCPDDACGNGGMEYCAELGATGCQNVNTFLCLQCTGGPSSSAQSSTSSGINSSSYSSSSSAKSSGICGNGFKEGIEECDDGNLRNDDGCNNSCQNEGGFCGDGVIQSLRGENCEPALTDPSSDCDALSCRLKNGSSSSRTVAVCGNGRREGMEECDDGTRNGSNTGSCNTSCKMTRGNCGDGIVQSLLGEECEPSFASDNSRFVCSPSCRLIRSQGSSTSAQSSVFVTGFCTGTECAAGGNEFCAARNEVCVTDPLMPCIACVPPDSSLPFSSSPFHAFSSSDFESSSEDVFAESSASSATVIVLNACGNGRIDPGELCDNGQVNSFQPNAFCRPDCNLGRCGDGITDTPLELCDEGSQNGKPGSTCNALCRTSHASNQVLPGTIIELPFNTPGASSSARSSTTATTDTVTIPGTALPPSTTSTGPATIVIMAAGAAAGYAWRRRRS